jgi:hypothetical protein
MVGQWLFEAAVKPFTDKSTYNELSQSELLKIINREFVYGQAEAYGILCKIICSVKSNEKIASEYLSRFYALLQLGLRVPNNLGEMNSAMEYESGEILATIIVNGCSIFKLDLDGVNILVNPMLNALSAVFKLKYPQKEEANSGTKTATSLVEQPQQTQQQQQQQQQQQLQQQQQQQQQIKVKSVFIIGSNAVSLVELKRYCIYILSSLLSLPNHFYPLGLDPASSQSSNFFSLRLKLLDVLLAAISNEQDTTNLQMLFACGRLIVGERAMDEQNKRLLLLDEQHHQQMSPSHTTGDLTSSSIIQNVDKKEKPEYCYKQVVSLICAPLKINNATLQNHSFALSIFESLASIAAGDIAIEDESVSKLSITWIWHYVKTQIKRRSRDHTREMHSVIVAAYNCLIMLLIKKPTLLKDKACLQTVTNCIEIGISGSSSYPEVAFQHYMHTCF